MKKIIFLLVFAVLLVSCSPSPEMIQEAIEQTQNAAPEEAPTATKTLEPTLTPEPTKTPTITLTPTSEPTATDENLTADDVINAFIEAGLEAEQPNKMTKDDYGMAPYVCEGTRFLVPSLGENSGGRIFICESIDKLESLQAYYTELGEISALFFSWVFTKDNILVQINGDLAEEIARQYEQALP